MLIKRVCLLPPVDGDKLRPIETKNEISKLSNIKDESFKNMLVRAMASRYEIHEIEDVQKVANTQGIQAMQNIQQMQDVQKIRQMQSIQQLFKTYEITSVNKINILG
jgi:MoaA/NifB/PqqE/SkfB family radical SAM enzyme